MLVAVAVAYVQPIGSYRQAEARVDERKAEIDALARAKRGLERRLAKTETDEFIEREARKLGLVRPGERLLIVKGVEKRREAPLR